MRPDDEAADWSLAIASAALRDRATARSVWRQLGILDNEGDGPILDGFGKTPVRLNPDGDGEVVWAKRLCPVRAQVWNIPCPESGFRFGDIVLHDGAPVGTRQSGGREYSAFDVLELLEASDGSTCVVEIQIERDDDAEELTSSRDEVDIPSEDWTTSVRTPCKQCSEGRAHETHDHELAQEWRDRHLRGVAAKEPAYAQVIVRKWANGKRRLVRFE